MGILDLPILQSQRGVLLLIALVMFFGLVETSMILEAIKGIKVDMTAVGIIGTVISMGAAYYYKDKATEAIKKIGE